MRLRFARLGKGFANRVINFDVRDGVRARGAANGRLVNQDHVVYILCAIQLLKSADVSLPVSTLFLESGVDAIVNQR